MASIQQSMNQMIGTAAAGVLTVSHLYKASPSYQTRKIEQQKKAEAEAMARDYDKKAGELAAERKSLISQIEGLKDKAGRRMTYRNEDYRKLAHQLEDVHSRHAMFVREAHKVSPSVARDNAVKTLPEPHESIGLTQQYEADQEAKQAKLAAQKAERASQKIQKQKKAEAEALASLEFKAKVMGITTEQLQARMALLKNKKGEID